MRAAIDVVTTLDRLIVVRGWSELRLPGYPAIAVQGRRRRTQVWRSPRPDLVGIFGERARMWGFCAVASDEDYPPAEDIQLRLAPGARLIDVRSATASTALQPKLWAQFVETANSAPCSVLELGARARSGRSYRNAFNGAVRYVGLDVLAGEGVNVVGDAHELSRLIREPIDHVFSISTFEHLIMPWVVALQLNAVLRPGGTVYTQSHQAWPLHDEPWDFFRFSAQAWEGIFNTHTGFRVLNAEYADPVAITGVLNRGGALNGLDRQRAWGLSASLAQKTSVPLVSWGAPIGVVRPISYTDAGV